MVDVDHCRDRDLGLCWSLLPRVGLRSLPDASAGQGAGVISTCNFIGLAVGTAAGSVVSSQIKRGEIDLILARLAPGASDVDALEVTLVHGSESEIAAALAKLSLDDAKKIETAMHGVFDSAISGVMVMMAVAGLIGAVLCFLTVRKRAVKVRPGLRGVRRALHSVPGCGAALCSSPRRCRRY